MTRSNNRIPLYSQIHNYINENIARNIWNVNDKLPSENELAQKFNVSRITVQNGLKALINDGIIVRVQGKGTFIASDKVDKPDSFKSLGENNIIAFMMPRLSNNHTINLFHGIEKEVSAQGYKLITCMTNDSQELETRLLHELVNMNIKGVIIFPVDGESYNEEILKLVLNNYPLVVIDRYLKGIETNCVVSDNIDGAYRATSHLIQSGHKKIGFVTNSLLGTSSAEDRLTGYQKALTEHSIPLEPRYLLTDLLTEDVNYVSNHGSVKEECSMRITEYLKCNPELTAIFTLNTSVGLNVWFTANDLNISVPEQLSIVFFDDDIPGYSSIKPTCVKQDETRIGIESAKLLLSLIENSKQPRKKIVIPTKLIVRNTTTSVDSSNQTE